MEILPRVNLFGGGSSVVFLYCIFFRVLVE